MTVITEIMCDSKKELRGTVLAGEAGDASGKEW